MPLGRLYLNVKQNLRRILPIPRFVSHGKMFPRVEIWAPITWSWIPTQILGSRQRKVIVLSCSNAASQEVFGQKGTSAGRARKRVKRVEIKSHEGW